MHATAQQLEPEAALASAEVSEDETIARLLSKPYKYGFKTIIESDVFPKGLSEDVVRAISAKKDEPEWMLEFRWGKSRRTFFAACCAGLWLAGQLAGWLGMRRAAALAPAAALPAGWVCRLGLWAALPEWPGKSSSAVGKAGLQAVRTLSFSFPRFACFVLQSQAPYCKWLTCCLLPRSAVLCCRLKAYRKWLTMEEPHWSDNIHPPIDFQARQGAGSCQAGHAQAAGHQSDGVEMEWAARSAARMLSPRFSF